MGVRQRLFPIPGIAAFGAGPVQKGQVQQAVDDVAVIVRLAHRPPGLDELALFLEAVEQLVGGQQRRLAAVCVADEFPRRHAARGIEEPHVVVVRLDAVDDPVEETLDVNLGGVTEGLVAGRLIGEPDFARPEAGGPLGVGHGRIEIVDARMVLGRIGECGQVAPHLRDDQVRRFGDFRRGDRGDCGAVGDVEHNYPLSPVEAMPSTKKRCRARKTMSTGISDTTDAAMISPYSCVYCEMNIRMPIWMVLTSVLVR